LKALGTQEISTEELRDMKNVVDFTFQSNYKQIKQNEYYQDLPPTIQKKMINYIVQEEKLVFRHFFSRTLSESSRFTVKSHIIQEIFLRIELELIIDHNHMIVKRND